MQPQTPCTSAASGSIDAGSVRAGRARIMRAGSRTYMHMPVHCRVLLGERSASRRCEGTTNQGAMLVDSSNRHLSGMLLAAAARPLDAGPSHPTVSYLRGNRSLDA
jgi:hypothetical protein